MSGIDFHGGDPNEDPPSWFTNEPEPEAEEPPGPFWRNVIAAGAILVLVVLLLIPILQAELLQRRRESLPEAAMDRTALLFASAILFGRSEGQAMLFASDESGDQVRDVLRVVITRPPPSTQARLQIQSTPCGRSDGDACFVGRIFDPSHPFQSGIRFGLDRVDDEPRVIWVEVDTTLI